MDTLKIALITVLGGLAGGLMTGGITYLLIPTRRELTRVRQMPITKIAALPLQGRVKTAGRAAGEELVSPFTETTCVFWRVALYRQTMHDEPDWEYIGERHSAESLELFDDTGRGRVFLGGADFEQLTTKQIPLHSRQSSNPRAQEVLNDIHVPWLEVKGFMGWWLIREQTIVRGQEIHLFGEVRQEDGARVLGGSDGGRLIISDQGEKALLVPVRQKLGRWVFRAAAIGATLGALFAGLRVLGISFGDFLWLW